MKQVHPELIRADIYSRRVHSIRPPTLEWPGWVKIRSPRRHAKSWLHWHMDITDGTKIIHRDDCRDLAKLHDEATRLVESYRLLVVAGHEFKSWDQLVDEAVI